MTKMRLALAVVVLLAVAPLGLAERRNAAEIAALAGSCSFTEIASCNTDTFGTLETGDCTFVDGARYDRYTFEGEVGQVVEIMVRPLSATYTNPLIWLLSPLGDTAEPPMISGGSGGASVWYKLSSSGTWIVLVGSDDLFAGGSYVLHFYCHPPEPQTPQSCIYQHLLCGQTASWELNADSCRFSNANKAYAGWWIYAVDGDRLRFEQTSFFFEPLFGLYKANGELLRSSTRDSSFRHTMSYLVRETGWYYFLTTSVENAQGGDIDVTLNCSGSGCTWPYLVTEPPSSTVVQRGTGAAIPFTVNALGGYTARLLDPNPLDGTIYASVTSPATSITTPPVTRPTTYVLDIENACGAWTSSPFTVLPEVARRRSVRK